MSQSDQTPSDDDRAGFIAICTIFGGPNGSGKSSLFGALSLSGEFVNADAIASKISPENPEAVSIQAGRQVLRRLDELIAAGQGFVYETTLSSHQSIDLMRRARDAGYEVDLVFVTLNSPDLNVERVADRVSRGGHHIPEVAIRRRYETSLYRLADAIRLAHESLIYDNSGDAPDLLLQISRGIIETNNLDEANTFHQRIAGLVRDALDVSADDVVGATKTTRQP